MIKSISVTIGRVAKPPPLWRIPILILLSCGLNSTVLAEVVCRFDLGVGEKHERVEGERVCVLDATPSGETRVSCEHNTSGLLFAPNEIVSHLSRVLTLEPGDLIFSGTSKAFIAERSETVTTEIEGFGVLTTKIVKSSI